MDAAAKRVASMPSPKKNWILLGLQNLRRVLVCEHMNFRTFTSFTRKKEIAHGVRICAIHAQTSDAKERKKYSEQKKLL